MKTAIGRSVSQARDLGCGLVSAMPALLVAVERGHLPLQFPVAEQDIDHQQREPGKAHRIGGDHEGDMGAVAVHQRPSIPARRNWRSLRWAISLRIATRSSPVKSSM